jgi:hypothetical protein
VTRAEVKRIADAACRLTRAHERRAPDHAFATLAEEAAVYALAEAIADLGKPLGETKAA